MMLNNYPDTFTLVQIQRDYPDPGGWNVARRTFYGITIYPTAWFDGVDAFINSLGSVQADYAAYQAEYLARRAVPTDVTIELGGEQVSGQTYRIHLRICIEPDGAAKDMRIQLVQLLDYWPPADTFTRNGFKQAVTPIDIHLEPGQCQFIQRDFTFDADSWASQDDIKIVAWAQQPNTAAPAEVYQAANMNWPFPPLVEPGSTSLPLTDDFPTATINTALWTGIEGAQITVDGSPGGSLNAPSLPYALNLAGSTAGGDRIRTARMDTSTLPDVLVEYHYQQTGNGSPPGPGEDLIVEYLNSNLDWLEIARYPGAGPDMTTFTLASHVITAANVFHPYFRVQFRVASSDADLDDWFIDNVYIYTTLDADPPQPDPMAWQLLPAPVSTTAIGMAAASAGDHWPPVQYFFEADAGYGGGSSPWQTAASYVNEGLTTNTLCLYRVRARDSAIPPNVGVFSEPVFAATRIETPVDLVAGVTTETTIDLTALGTFTNLVLGDSGLFFLCLESGANSGWIKETSWLAAGLQAGTQYTFLVKARNQTGHETGWIQTFASTTNGGACSTYMGDANGDGLLNGMDVSAFVEALINPPGSPCVNYSTNLEASLHVFLDDLLGPPEPDPTVLNLGPEEFVQAAGEDITVPGYSVPSYDDWNNDARNDLLVGEGSGTATPKIRVYLNTGTVAAPAFATFFYVQSNGTDLTAPGAGCLGVFPRVVHWDGDGRKDLLVGLADGKVKVYLNVGTDEDPTFDGGAFIQVGQPGFKADIDVGMRATPVTADYDHDGVKDLAVGALDGKLHVFLNSGADDAPDFRAEQIAQAGPGDLVAPSARTSPVLLDLDQDGRIDLLTGNTDGQLVFYSNCGTEESPSFSARYAFVTADGLAIDLPATPRSRPFVCDWTGDGQPDVLLGAGDGKVRLYQGLPGD